MQIKLEKKSRRVKRLGDVSIRKVVENRRSRNKDRKKSAKTHERGFYAEPIAYKSGKGDSNVGNERQDYSDPHASSIDTDKRQ